MSNAKAHGRLAAALEYLGYLDDRGVAIVSTSPQSLIPHLGQATASGERARDILTHIMAEIPASGDPFPVSLPNQEQGDFWIAYHHQRAAFRAGQLPKGEPSPDDRWEIRIESDLKTWALENGGSKLVRTLLRRARNEALGINL